ncbi:hypothetical protein BDQ12DRAFT_359396 [Crucibulum laeve]|uniref:Uncharacterized protein n=1 Tax=Crucibulum laeve TaxID=68775 RepID=A0A5C3MEH6_9AGAR|nr:hypothetical protein BDQ12DRAFT_359396 [Crucibulum laeve]
MRGQHSRVRISRTEPIVEILTIPDNHWESRNRIPGIDKCRSGSRGAKATKRISWERNLGRLKLYNHRPRARTWRLTHPFSLSVLSFPRRCLLPYKGLSFRAEPPLFPTIVRFSHLHTIFYVLELADPVLVKPTSRELWSLKCGSSPQVPDS